MKHLLKEDPNTENIEAFLQFIQEARGKKPANNAGNAQAANPAQTPPPPPGNATNATGNTNAGNASQSSTNASSSKKTKVMDVIGDLLTKHPKHRGREIEKVLDKASPHQRELLLNKAKNIFNNEKAPSGHKEVALDILDKDDKQQERISKHPAAKKFATPSLGNLVKGKVDPKVYAKNNPLATLGTIGGALLLGRHYLKSQAKKAEKKADREAYYRAMAPQPMHQYMPPQLQSFNPVQSYPGMF